MAIHIWHGDTLEADGAYVGGRPEAGHHDTPNPGEKTSAAIGSLGFRTLGDVSPRATPHRTACVAIPGPGRPAGRMQPACPLHLVSERRRS